MRASDACKAVREEIFSLPDIRAEKVRMVQERIRQGFYDRPEILEEVVSHLLTGWPRNRNDLPQRGEP